MVWYTKEKRTNNNISSNYIFLNLVLDFELSENQVRSSSRTFASIYNFKGSFCWKIWSN